MIEITKEVFLSHDSMSESYENIRIFKTNYRILEKELYRNW